ncbi:radical SAM protein, partial [Candidatus Poribacteria bacterium]|nr:radical SAM protein [Candidatus Poribacteria bacterium]
AVAEHVNLISHYIPYVQTNFILGLDVDEGPLPFELTKRFLDLVPTAFPAYSLFTAFGNSAPLNLELQGAGRVLDIPFHFLDNHSALNVRLKNYEYVEFYDQVIGLMRHSFSPRMMWERFKASKQPLPRWMNLLRAISSEGRGRYHHYVKTRHQFATDREFIDFFAGESKVPPSFYHNRLKAELGHFYDYLPARVLSYLKQGEPTPNSRVGDYVGFSMVASKV